jgi:three-Cys-motif partner protein
MEISLHSNQKHIALGYYLSIIRDVIMSPKTPFKRLYYVDLYCGDGSCEIKRTGEKYSPPIIDSILKEAKENNFPVYCFLNDLDPQKIDDMKDNTEDYKEFIKDCSSDDANTCYEKFLKQIPKDQFCIFFLDPSNHKDLKWDTIKKISEHSHSYLDQIRRPELIINCMTYSMTNAYRAKDYKSINESLGTDEWINLINKYKDENIDTPVERAFLDTFVKQLEKLGYKVPSPIKIKSTRAGNTIYYLVWATNEKGYSIIEKRVIPYLMKTILKTREDNKKALIRAEAKEKGDSSLENWGF